MSGCGGPADSAGTPWGGRTLPASGFEEDTGECDPALLAALASGDDREAMAALASARLLVPVTAVAAETTQYEGRHGPISGDKETDMAVVLLDNPDGRSGLPVFTGLATLAEWDPQLRPIPVPASRAAQAAIGESADVLIVDCASEHAFEVRSSMLWALAMEREWLPAHLDGFVAVSVAAACRDEEAVRGHRVADAEPAGSGTLVIELTLAPGLRQDEVQELVTRIGERLATDGEFRARVDALTFRVH